MPHAGRLALAVVASFAIAPSPALADRAPTKTERTAIKRASTRNCDRPPVDCTFKKARVSTENPRYAFATVIGEGISGVLLKRKRPHARRFKRIGFQGGGIQTCPYWESQAPRAVLRDLRIKGLDPATGSTRRCG